MLNLLAVGAGDTGVNPWVALAYLVAGVCFILALRGLSSPATSRRGNRLGMFGMAIAVVTTLVTHELASPIELAAAIGIGCAVGWVIAPMAMPSPISILLTAPIPPSGISRPKAAGLR